MASILRSGKFLRCFTGFMRNTAISTVRESDRNLQLYAAPCVCNRYKLRSFATAAVPSAELSLDKQLRRLDQDVRRVGRISRRDIEEVLEEIRNLRTATSSQSLLVIRCCGNLVPEELPEVRTALVQDIWRTLNTLNVPMDISHYNALLRVYLENEHPFSPTDFLAELESKAIEPNRVTYQRLIARYCQNGDIEGATRILEHMREKNLPVNENVFNSLIVGHSQANDLKSAKGIMGVMKQAGLEPSADTYATLLCCYARHGDIQTIITTIQECEKNEIYLLDKDFLDIAYELIVSGNGDKADAVLKKLRISVGFNQDAINTILRLVNKGYENEALPILRLMPRSTRPDGQLIDAGSFFIKQLVKANKNTEKIINICKMLQKEGLNSKAILVAAEVGVANGIIDQAFTLLKEMQKAGYPIRHHYFWPLICSVKSNQILEVLKRMQDEFQIVPNAETLRDYVIPQMKEKNFEKIISQLRDFGVSSGNAAASVSHLALTENKFKDAALIMESYSAYYSPALFRPLLVTALNHTSDYSSYVRCVRQIYDHLGKQSQKTEVGAEEVDGEPTESYIEDAKNKQNGSPEVLGHMLNDVCSYFKTNRIPVLEKVVEAFVEEGLTVSNGQAMRLSERIGGEMTPRLSEMLGKLSSGELTPVPLKATSGRKRNIENMSIEELERLIRNVESRGENASNLKRFLLNACFRSKNLDKCLKFIEKLKAESFDIPIGVNAQLIDLYVYHNKVEEALELYSNIKSQDPTFVLDNFKSITLSTLLVKEDRVDEALKILKDNKKSVPLSDGEPSFNYYTTVWRLLNALAETGDAQKLDLVFNEIIEGHYALPTNVILGPLIKVHLVNDDLEKAMESFEKICEKYKSTPWKNELACRLIQKEDAANLQKLTDLSTAIHGEVNSLYDLVFSFVECGRTRQARKILETPGMRTRPHRIEAACERYKNEGLTKPLEGLIEATKDLNHIDRSSMYYNLLESYEKTNDAEKALGLWTRMQEENITPSDEFLNKLAAILKDHNIEVPFVVPTESNIQEKKSIVKRPAVIKVNTAQSISKLYNDALKKMDLEKALALKQQIIGKEPLSFRDDSVLVELLLRADRLNEATKYLHDILDNGGFPTLSIFKFYLNRLASAGDVEAMRNIGEKINEDQKRKLSFDNRIAHANIVAGNSESFLQKLWDDVSKVKTETEAAALAVKFPRGGALGILENNPQLVTLFEKIAEEYAKYNQSGPMNILWIFNILQGREDVAKTLFNKHLLKEPRLMFQRVLQTARKNNDENLVKILIDQLHNSSVSESAIGNAYSCLIDVLVSKNHVDDALIALNDAVRQVCLENINQTALTRLKLLAEQENKDFPFSLEEIQKSALSKARKNEAPSNDVSSTSSSDSSSDDDVTPKRPETRPPRPHNAE